ncbi:mitogen-activated protein kinase kinase kinase 7-interacting protein 3 homolog isoform X2 [Mya arenaria]|uniref:mitogen-activated protein kinase kinase kinase 7-interacting protein 3 homolog isoform X2 n=1 Tax=Mya arenaria TaxID=6604 RepID=UPI0022DFAD48|nr:mitogen-activated protein kinase kinase kinase 7-interacting protein 3 homolog isoform X2 [Mya arenaria]
MASVDRQLFLELKNRYPEVPDNIVTKYCQQFCNNRERCIEMLTNESPRYLFGTPTNQHCRLNEHLTELNLEAEPRARSDSSSSNMSNASSGSTPLRPPLTSSQGVSYNVPGFRGPITAIEHPSTAPVMRNEINQFMNQLQSHEHHASSGDIPNINCNNSSGSSTSGYSGYRTNYGQHSTNSSACSSPAMLRPIEVQHVQTSGGDNRESPTQAQGPITYRFQINPGGVGSQPGTPSRGWVFQGANPNMPYQNVTYPSEHHETVMRPTVRTLPISQQQFSNSTFNTLVRSQYNSPGDELPSYTLYGGQEPGNFPGQHSSQATFFISNPTASPNPGSHHYPTMPRTVQQSPIQGLYNPGSMNDVRLSPNVNVMRSNSTNSQPSPQGISGPVVVEIKTPRTGTGVQSQIQFFNNISGTPVSNPQASAAGYMGHVSPQEESNVTHDPSVKQSFLRQYQPERPTVINFQKPDDSNAGFMKFPPMPSECRVPGHAHGLQKASSVDSESVFVSEMEYNRQPFMSPASSHSSLNSESSSAMRTDRPQSSGSVEEPGYLQALLSHQKSRMEKLKHDLCVAEDRLTIMRGDVTSLERDVIERKRLKSNVFPSSVDLAKLRGDNLQLQAEIQLMTREIDLFNNGQTPLGVLDPIEQQNFYKNMNTGQRGSIYASASTSAPTVTHVSTVTTSIPSRPLPSRPPPEIPPQLPPRDPPRNSDVPPPLPPRLVLVPPVPPAQPAVNSGDSDADGEPWSCSACTFLNYPALTKCEVCEMPRMSSLSPITSPRGEDIPDTYATPVANTPTT